MKFHKPESEDFVDFLSLARDEEQEKEPETGNQKEQRRKRLEQSFTPLIDKEIHTDVTGENMKITVNKEDDTVKSIDIECRCGRKSRLLLQYEE